MKFTMKKKVLVAALIPALGLPLAATSFAAGNGQQTEQTSGQSVQNNQEDRSQRQQQQRQQNVRDMRATEMIGATVRNKEDKDLGEVQDLIVDLNGERVDYAILAFGGFMGFGEKLFAYPMDRFEARSEGDDKQLVLNVSEQELENAPGFDRSNWPNWGDGGYRGEVDKHFGRTAAAGGSLVRMSELLDKNVSDQAGKDVGQIQDVVVSVKNGQVRFVALEPDGSLDMGERIVMVPLNAIHATNEQQFEARQSGTSGESGQAEASRERAEGSSGMHAQQQDNATGQMQQIDPAGTTDASGASGQRDDTNTAMVGREQDRELKLVMQISPEQLRNARSFSQDQWPDLNSRSFQRDMERYAASFPSTSNRTTGSSGDSGSQDAAGGESDVKDGTTSGSSATGDDPNSMSGATGGQGAPGGQTGFQGGTAGGLVDPDNKTDWNNESSGASGEQQTQHGIADNAPANNDQPGQPYSSGGTSGTDKEKQSGSEQAR